MAVCDCAVPPGLIGAGGVKGAWSVTITNPEELEVRSWKFEIALHCTQKEATSALS